MTDISNLDEFKPWERQKGESTKAYEYFTRFRDMGAHHSLRALAKQEGISLHSMWLFSKKWKWMERIAAWHDELDKIKRETTIKEVQEMTKRHSQQSMMFQRILILPVEAALEKLKNNDPSVAEFKNLTLKELFEKSIESSRMFSAVVDIERKSRGEPSEILKQDLVSNGQQIKVILPPGANAVENAEDTDFLELGEFSEDEE